MTQNIDYATQDGVDPDLLSSPVKVPKHMQKGDNSDTDFQAQGAESDDNETEGYDSATISLQEELKNGAQTNGHLSNLAAPPAVQRVPPTLSQPTVKGKSFITPDSTRPTLFPILTSFQHDHLNASKSPPAQHHTSMATGPPTMFPLAVSLQLISVQPVMKYTQWAGAG